MRKITLTFESYNEEALRIGLAKLGLSLEELSDKELANILAHALGYVDYTNEVIAKDLLNNK